MAYNVIEMGSNAEVTGSINKILILNGALLDRVEFGSHGSPDFPTSAVETITTTNIVGTYLDGPIGAVSGSNLLVYLNV